MSVLDSILDVFTSIGNWISEAVTDLQPMFWTSENGLTFLGVLAVAGLAFSVVFLIIGYNIWSVLGQPNSKKLCEFGGTL